MDNSDAEKVTSEISRATLDEAFLVAVALPFDADDPKNWPSLRKWLVTGVLSMTTFNRIVVSTIVAPVLLTIGAELHMTSIESIMALSAYVLAGAFGPMIIGPLSKVYGRARRYCTRRTFGSWSGISFAGLLTPQTYSLLLVCLLASALVQFLLCRAVCRETYGRASSADGPLGSLARSHCSL